MRLHHTTLQRATHATSHGLIAQRLTALRAVAVRTVLFTAFTAVLMLRAAAGLGAADLRWSLESGLEVGWGRAAYDLESEIGGGDFVLSRLEFPLDGVSASAGVLLSIFEQGQERWRFRGGAALAMSDPAGLMRDYDWIETAGFPKIPFSYTESPVEALAVGARVQASRTMGIRGPLELYLWAGYRFHYLYQSVRGYEGWQYEWNDGIGAFDLWLIWGSGEVLRYTLSCHALPLGLGLRLAGGPRLRLSLEAGWMPVYAMDEDDHLLRYKLSTASGLGHGVEGRLEAVWLLAERGRGKIPYLSLAAEGLAWRVSTTQTQEWYGDDPAGSGDETGLVVTGIGHVITASELRFTFSAGLSF